MPNEEELIQERMRKLGEIRKRGVDPYPHIYQPKHKAAELQEKYAKLKANAVTKDKVNIAGRIMALRRMGKITFLHVEDGSGKMQVLFKAELKDYDFLKLFDRGDWIGVEGMIIKTKTNETTVDAKKFTMLCKSLYPLPEKWHGLQDVEQRYRQRYVDLIMNPDVRRVFVQRTQIVNSIREHLNKQGFLEVNTPTLQPMYGGAAARPFQTHLNALDMKLYLRISDELYLKRLLVGGYEKVYEFAQDFRNEGIDRTHNPEFTQIEIYQAYADFNDMMKLTEDLYISACKAVHGSTTFEYQGKKINVKKPWKRYTMIDAVKKFAGIDIEKMDDKELFGLRKTYKLTIEGELTRGTMMQALFEELVESKLEQPTFITHHPIESTPLCKPCRKHPTQFAERFEPFIMGMEVGNAYTELNDPVLQRKLLEEQAKALRSGAEKANPMDEDFVRAIEYGMPPTGGLGIGIDRMTMLLTNQPSIRDVIFFPFMK